MRSPFGPDVSPLVTTPSSWRPLSACMDGRSSGHSGGSAVVLTAGVSAVTPSHAAKIVALERHRRDRGDLDHRAEIARVATLLRKWNAPKKDHEHRRI